MPVQKGQVFQHIRVCGVARLQGKRLPLCVLRSWLLGDRVYIAPALQLLISLPVADAFQSGVQRNAVALCAAEVAVVLVSVGVQAQMMFPRTVVAAEGTAGLDLRTPQRPGVDDQPAPPGRVHDGDLLIDQAGSPFLYAALDIATATGRTGRTDSSALLTHFARSSCPVGRAFSRSSMDSILSTNTG